MTYCLAVCVNDGLVFVSDSRTNAGIDQLGTFSKMYRFDALDDRFFTLLSAGNLATTQAVVARLERDLREGAKESLASINRIRQAAEYIGRISRKAQSKYAEDDRSDGFAPEADFIFGGQISGEPHKLFHIYSQGNFLSPTELAPYLQIGEQKYGKPILDRVITMETKLELAARCGIVSMDSTIRSNASVGPPIELLIYPKGLSKAATHIVYNEDDPFLRKIRSAWAENVVQAFEKLPPINLPSADRLRLLDSSDS